MFLRMTSFLPFDLALGGIIASVRIIPYGLRFGTPESHAGGKGCQKSPSPDAFRTDVSNRYQSHCEKVVWSFGILILCPKPNSELAESLSEEIPECEAGRYCPNNPM